MSASKLCLPECEINFDTPNRMKILKTGLRRASKENILGRGAYGTVIKAIYKEKHVAVKIINNSSSFKKLAVQNECQILNWKHENIVEILKVESTPNHSAIIMERFQGKCLQSILDEIELPLYHRLLICEDIIVGLNFCHKNGILHLDVKPQNILVALKNDYAAKRYVCKLCDFGSSKRIVTDFCAEKNIQGTIRYMSPEGLKSQPLTPASDIFSFGITMWQLKSRICPYFRIDCNDVVAYKVVKDNLRPISPIKDAVVVKGSAEHKQCVCQHFASESSKCSNRKTLLEGVTPEKSSVSPFQNRKINQLTKCLSVSTAVGKKLHYGSDAVNTMKIESVEKLDIQIDFPENNLEEDFDLKLVFNNCFISEESVKEHQYKDIYRMCWQMNPLDRPSGLDVQNFIQKILKPF